MSKASVMLAGLALAAGATLLAASPDDAQAQGAKQRRGGYGTVTACSRYGRGCITARVRWGAVEDEVQLPGGTWIGCRSDCRETLREEAVDFWETQRERRGGDNWR